MRKGMERRGEDRERWRRGGGGVEGKRKYIKRGEVRREGREEEKEMEGRKKGRTGREEEKEMEGRKKGRKGKEEGEEEEGKG